MPFAANSYPRKRQPAPMHPSNPSSDRKAAARLASFLSIKSDSNRRPVQIVDGKGSKYDLPTGLLGIVRRAAELLAEGRSVTILPEEQMLTTQEAANVLRVSRQYVVRLVDSGELPAERVGSHRRLRISDVAAYKAQRHSKGKVAADTHGDPKCKANGHPVVPKSNEFHREQDENGRRWTLKKDETNEPNKSFDHRSTWGIVADEGE